MPKWLIEILQNPAAVTAIGTVLVVPLLSLVGKILDKRSPAPPPIASEIRDLPQTPLLLAAKVHLQDEERGYLVDAHAKIDHVNRKVDIVMDRLDLLSDQLDLIKRR